MEFTNPPPGATGLAAAGRGWRRIGDFRAGELRRLPRRDRSWRGTIIAKAIGGLRPPMAERLRDQLYALASAGAGAGAPRLLDVRDGTAGRPIAADLRTFCDALVAVDDAPASAGLGEHVARIRRTELAGLPFRFTVGPDWVGLVHNHAIGDGNTSFRLMLDLAAGSVPSYLVSRRPGVAFPLARALLRTFARRPGSALAVIRGPRAPLPVFSGAGETAPIRSDVEVAAWRSEEGYLSWLRGERAASGGKWSVFAHVIASTFEYLRGQGVTPYPGFTVVVDARRYLAAGSEVIGNFSAGSFLECGPAPTPDEVARALRRLLRDGRPLLSMVMSAARADVNVTRWRVDPAARPLLSFSHQGKVTIPPTLEDQRSRPRIVTMGLPLGPHGISVHSGEAGGSLHVSASYRPDATRADLIRGLVHALASGGQRC